MNESELTLTAADGTKVAGYCWRGVDAPKAIVQIAHGMGEHAARYRRVAEALTKAGYVVYAHDHRGHGKTAGSPERFGDLGAGGWRALVADLGALSELARRDHPGLPLALFGHSMGSFALQQYLLDHSDDLDAAVLSGTSAVDVIAGLIDPTQEADLSVFNAAFEPARTESDWLSRDEAEVDKYIADPMCGFGLNGPSVATMIDGSAALADGEHLRAIRSELPILLMSGEADPLAGGGALVEMVASRYREAGSVDVTVILYPGARHEILNETNRDEVTADLLDWLERVIG